MAAVIDLTRATTEATLIIRQDGQPAAWRWRGRMYGLLRLHARWTDSHGTAWYRVESEEGLQFLLKEAAVGWSVSLWPRTDSHRSLATAAIH